MDPITEKGCVSEQDSVSEKGFNTFGNLESSDIIQQLNFDSVRKEEQQERETPFENDIDGFQSTLTDLLEQTPLSNDQPQIHSSPNPSESESESKSDSQDSNQQASDDQLGEISNQQANDFWTETLPDGRYLTGNFEANNLTGTGALFTQHGQKISSGNYEDGILTGEGKLYNKYGNVERSGFFKEDKLCGQGILFDISGKPTYVGLWLDGVKSGRGVETSQTGTYDGGFLENRKHGYGEISYTNQDYYKGYFRLGCKSGVGSYFSKTENSLYKGDWLSDLKNGTGTIVYHSSSEKCTAQFLDGKISGYGTFEYSNGDTYQGTFSDGLKSGYGV